MFEKSKDYAEPCIRYDKQASYWKNKPKNLESMANCQMFQDSDLQWTKDFMEEQMSGFVGGRVLDLCGGIGRNGQLLMQFFDTIDIIDLEPDFGSTPTEKQGTLFRGNLADIRLYIKDTQYDCLFGSWALCYI